MKCEFCGLDRDRQEWCDWQQGRCPNRKKPALPWIGYSLVLGSVILILVLGWLSQ